MLCETNLNVTIVSSVFPNNFIVYRCDRSDETEKVQATKRVSGGGVAIAVDRSFK